MQISSNIISVGLEPHVIFNHILHNSVLHYSVDFFLVLWDHGFNLETLKLLEGH